MIIIIFLTILVVTLGFTTINLLNKIEKCEDVISSYDEFLTQLSKTIQSSNEKLKEIDNKGTFESDDEVGFFFKHLLLIQNQLNNFQINLDDQEKK